MIRICRSDVAHEPAFAPQSRDYGAVLLEVVLALALFVAAAAIIGSSLSSSVTTVDRLRWESLASNLAASTIAEIELGLLPLLPSSPTPFEPPFEEWTWEIIPGEASRDATAGAFPLERVEVVIRHAVEPVVFRLAQWLPVGSNSLNAPFLSPDSATFGRGASP